jgi:tellurite methyltransferase
VAGSTGVSESSSGRSESARTSVFFEAHLPDLVEAAAGRPVLDLACGSGRHAIAAARDGGLRVLAVDRDREALDRLACVDIPGRGSIEVEVVDLETAAAPSLSIERFGGIVVSRYLHRPLTPWIEEALAPGGLLLYETFRVAQRELGWGPRRADFLLESGELLSLFPHLEVCVYEEGPSGDDPSAETARLLARRPR